MSAPQAPQTDEELMERFCAGDQHAFEALYKRMGPIVQRFLTPMVRDAALAEDLCQLTFLSAIRSRDRYTRGAKVGPWMLTIAANAARDALRRRGREGSATMNIVTQVEPDVSDPGMRRQIESALQQLPEAQREAVILHKLQGYSFDQVAEVLGTSSTAARIRAHRGYERLKELLTGFGIDLGGAE